MRREEETSLHVEPDVRKFFGDVNRKLRNGHDHAVIVENNAPVDDRRKAELFNDQFSQLRVCC